MAKPRTFVSSTYFDLSDARASIMRFLDSIGHEPLLHELPTFGVTPGKHSHAACIDQVDNADYLVLVVGGRRGGTYVQTEKSITSEEYRRAIRRKIPVMIFVKSDVEKTSLLYKKNPKADFSSVIDDPRVFDFIDALRAQSEDNWIRSFDTVNDIIDGLKGQFAYIHLLFSKRHVKDRTSPSKELDQDERYLAPFPSDLSALTEGIDNDVAASLIAGLRRVHDVLRTMQERRVQGYGEKAKVLWLLGRYGEIPAMRHSLTMPEPSFKQYAWGTNRGQRVFDQLKDFGVYANYEPVDSDTGPSRLDVDLGFDDDGEACYALSLWVKDLIAKYGEDDGLVFFARGDLALYGSGANSATLPSRRELLPASRSTGAARGRGRGPGQMPQQRVVKPATTKALLNVKAAPAKRSGAASVSPPQEGKRTRGAR